MAKGDGKKSKDKIKIPKRIAGVKVSKAVRKAGKSAIRLAESPAVSETVAAALLVYRRGRTPGAERDVPEHRNLAPAGR